LLDQSPTLLRIADIREIGGLGMIIDSVDELIAPSDVITIQKIYEYQFELVGKSVVDERKHKVGKVVGYTVEAGDFVIQQLRVHRPLLRSFGDTELLIHRSQIIKVTDDTIIVKSATVSHKVEETVVPITRAYDNPFRKAPQPSPETIDRN
jgi:sporulation protein YlmC with PRC-barrel domain